MPKFVVYFEFFGRFMKFETEADNEDHAKELVSRRITFLRVEREKGQGGRVMDILNGIFK